MDCEHCKRFAHENEELTDEISGLLDTTRRQGREIVGLKNELRQRDADDPSHVEVRILLENWKRLNGKTDRCIIAPGSKRWKIAKAALKREDCLQDCIESIEGYALLPYVVGGQRRGNGKPSERYDDLEYALGDETRVDKGRKYRAMALGADEPALFRAWKAADATKDLYFSAWWGKWNRERTTQEQARKQAELVSESGWGNVVDISSVRKDAA